MSAHQFAFGIDRAARITVADDGEMVRVTLTVRGLDGVDHVIRDVISRSSALNIAAGFREAALDRPPGYAASSPNRNTEGR